MSQKDENSFLLLKHVIRKERKRLVSVLLVLYRDVAMVTEYKVFYWSFEECCG